MRALVTGGAGFIGSNLVRRLFEERLTVRILDNFSSGYRTNVHPDAEVVEGDVRDAGVVDAAVAGCDLVFHLAASVGNTRSIEHPIEDTEINALGTLRVLEAARAHRVKRIVYSSSAGIFGELKTLPIDESHPIDPDTPYGASKLAGEKLCLAYGKLYPLEAVCLRYFNVYGVNQRYDAYGNVIPIFAHRVLAGEALRIFGDGEQTRDLVNVRDVAEANLRAATCESVSGAFNIASGTRVTINDLAHMVCDAAGRPRNIKHEEPRKGDVRHSLADITRARAAFGYAPAVPLASGLTEYMTWAARAGV
jgi:UDP-glucose 4-epimerase